jgi:probable DNA metabolism protein
MDNYKIYVYDGTFYGILTAIYEIYYCHDIPLDIAMNINHESPQINFLNENKTIVTDYEKALKVSEGIKKKISIQALDNIYYAFLSNVKGKEMVIFDYIKLGFKMGSSIDVHLYDEKVMALHKIVKRVRKEIHLMTGFIRFTYINTFYYASYEPDHNITELLAPSFAERFADQYFIIHDVLRNIAAVYNTKEWVIISFDNSDLNKLDIVYSEEDSLDNSENYVCYEKLWKEYFVNTAIDERKNEKHQKSLMPKRYWKNMLETEELK